ncbi:MAG: 2-hydroxyacid dehydrogenase [Acidimicrobiales bacterium]
MTTLSPRPSVVVALPLAPPVLAPLAAYDVTLLPGGRSDDAAFRAALAQCEGVLVGSHVPMDRSAIASAPKLRVISTMSVGVDHIDLGAARERGVLVTITPVLSDAVADLAMALVTMLCRRIPQGMAAVAGGVWNKIPLSGDLAGRVLLIVGFGRIGQAVAKRALAADMQVHYVDAERRHTDLAVRRVGELARGLREADVVSLHVNLNAATENLMGAKEFGLMKSTAYLVNTSRGGVVDQAALARALTLGEIAGAGLDVLREEPPRPDDPILTAPHTIIVPHIGSATVETRDAMAHCAVDNLVMGLADHADPAVVVS